MSEPTDKDFADNGKVSSTGTEPGRTMTHEEREVAQAAARFGYGPLAQVSTTAERLPAFGGEFQPGLYRSVEQRKFANPAPMGLASFALTTFLLSLINLQTRGVTTPNIVVASAYGYGGLVQLLAGMWEMAVGNTFGATALSSYGGFWITYGIMFTPGGFEIVKEMTERNGVAGLQTAVGLWLFGWWIFTTLLLLCTLKSTVVFFLLFLTVDLAFLMLALGHIFLGSESLPNTTLVKAGGGFGVIASFLAWYSALAGLADTSNSFFIIPVAHFPWSAKALESRKIDRETV
ncbi:hypothetical protein PABG_07647 [Paracoccidioides brasiliensis Pb03]|uniref:Uncharacterized protein n=1 Tax=Paracoccidioides brasiliensis TaxID=121759 RepID=A0A1D2J3X9_PARBR|nr:hypothetical protein PABG_07647 [Paracoccidioides brasiliensis Pb03]ODH13000.1 hypothetical protein ACO22_07702 [Paracoccidioides brasiliensis]ODH46773.1 hypothetical protein GX48_07137 [Paracoccidioides brasiliensis]